MKDGSEDHAIVLGGSIAGLLAARVLADAYDQVTVVDRDDPRCGRAGRDGARRKAGTSTGCSPAASRYWTSCSPGSPPSSRRTARRPGTFWVTLGSCSAGTVSPGPTPGWSC